MIRRPFSVGPQRTTSGWRAFAADRQGVGAVEFALIAPVLLILYMGGVDVTLAVTLHRKLQHATATMNDLISRNSQVKQEDLDGIFNIAVAALQPYDASILSMKSTAVTVDATGKASVDWSKARSASADPKGAPIALPAGLAAARSVSFVLTTTTYRYVPLGGFGLMDPIDMGDTNVLRARTGTTVSCTDC